MDEILVDVAIGFRGEWRLAALMTADFVSEADMSGLINLFVSQPLHEVALGVSGTTGMMLSFLVMFAQTTFRLPHPTYGLT